MRIDDFLHPSGLANLSLDNAIRVHVQWVLEYTDGSLSWAAEELGIDKATLYRHRERWRLPVKRRAPTGWDRRGPALRVVE